MYQFRKNILSAGLIAMTVFTASVLPVSAAATADAEKTTVEKATVEKASVKEQASASQEAYLYTSKEYGYSIYCPFKPLGVIPASVLYEGKKGDILVFQNQEYTILNGWVILVDAFDTAVVPDLNTVTEEEAADYLQKLMNSNGYEGISLVNISENNKGIFAVTAKEVEIDTNGDGVPDMTATADTQQAVTFFRSAQGRCFSVQLIDNPTLRPEAVAIYQIGVSSLKDLAPAGKTASKK